MRASASIVLLAVFSSHARADQIAEAREICAFFEQNGLQGDCKPDPLQSMIDITLNGFYDTPPECRKIADMLRSFRLEPGRNWRLAIHARTKDEPKDFKCNLGKQSL